MPKRLIVCCDGTWNSPDQLNNGHPAPTNVTRLALAVAARDGAGVEQRTFYHPGVGTKRSERIRGGAFGYGLSRDVRDTYRFIVENYEPLDELFLLGFSRGAYTARSVAGFVRNCGILRPEHADRLRDAYALYRDRGDESHPHSVAAQLFRKSYSFQTRIRFIGVWDTVGALGIPLNGFRFLNIVNHRNKFHDTALSSKVDAAYQALAIDEKRKPFQPAIWTQSDPTAAQVVEQVWFAGVHCNVGGGYNDHSLADVPLRWMVDKAVANGLAVDETVLTAGPFAEEAEAAKKANLPAVDPCAPSPDPLAPKQESRKSFYRLIPPYVRPMEPDAAKFEWASSSAEARFDDPKSAYQPANLARWRADHGQVMPVRTAM